MTKEKLKSLSVYKAKLTEKLNDKVVPAKHLGHPSQYRNFLINEIRIVSQKLEDEALLATKS